MKLFISAVFILMKAAGMDSFFIDRDMLQGNDKTELTVCRVSVNNYKRKKTFGNPNVF